MQPATAAREFDIKGRLVNVDIVGQGNVNDTYQAVFRDGGSVERIILQRINKHVFEQPDWIMENMRYITDHVLDIFRAEPSDTLREWGIPKIVTHNKKDFMIDDDGDFWRAMSMIDDAKSYAKIRNSEHAYEVGIVLGCFHRTVSNLSSDNLHDTLPGFHVTPNYLRQYDEILDGNYEAERMNNTPGMKNIMNYIDSHRDKVNILQHALEQNELQIRIIHGDPKVDNIMIDNFTGYGIGIIDLDTVKPGLLHYDFGDALRSACNPAGEDETDLDSVFFDIDLCAAFVEGYMEQAKNFITEADRNYLFDAIHLITFELGLRFFQDYLAGDKYFKVRFEGHNLNRAKVQFKLCESIKANEKTIRKTLDASTE
ncbi:MAG: aminoglycoside phosphotransferase family protein [Kiritimatiellae bacterium]|nr:aminoglycoside phosphotransferase family protein [Kiritimatiellia bacterium]